MYMGKQLPLSIVSSIPSVDASRRVVHRPASGRIARIDVDVTSRGRGRKRECSLDDRVTGSRVRPSSVSDVDVGRGGGGYLVFYES